MMKIGIAGTNGLAQFIAYYLSVSTSHNFVFLSRTTNPGLSRDKEWQVLVVDYDEPTSLAYKLRGLDIVISTIAHEPQMTLIEASARAQVRHFIPSAFSGPEQCQQNSSQTCVWTETIELLDHIMKLSSMTYTIFTCGILYEHFGPGGLNALQISTFENRHGAIGEEGNFLIDLRTGKSTIPVVSSTQELNICLTSLRDVARYVVAALKVCEDTSAWPREFNFCAERLTMSELRAICERVRGTPIIPTFTNRAALRHALEAAQQKNNSNEALAISQHIAVADSHPAISFSQSNINLFPNILAAAHMSGTESDAVEAFESWLVRAWSNPIPSATGSRSNNTSGKRSGKSSRSGSSQKSKRAIE